jgi:PAS domain S-box-containing protein
MWQFMIVSQYLVGWFFASYTLQPVGFMSIEIVKFAYPQYFLYVGSSYILMLIALSLLFMRGLTVRGIYRLQTFSIFFALLIPTLTTFQRTFQWADDLPNLLPIGFLGTILSIALALYVFRFLDITPIAKSAVFAAIPQYVFVIDQRRRIVDANPATLRLLRQPLEQLVGTPLETILPEVLPLMESLPLDPEKSSLSEIQPTQLGTIQYAEAQLSPLMQRNKLAGYLLFLQDITEQKHVQIERENLIQLLDSYARMVAHDLKNPLSVITSYVSMIQESDANDPLVEHYLNQVQEASQLGLKITDNLLLLARVRNTNPESIVSLDMVWVLTRAIEQLQDRISANAVQVDWAMELPPAMGNEVWVEQLWVNLISNAIKYGGKPPIVHIEGVVIQGCARYSIQDNGDGITATEMARLFQQFNRLERHQNIKGVGVGLTIAETIVKKLGGQIGVESTVGQGTTFWFTLPAVFAEGKK